MQVYLQILGIIFDTLVMWLAAVNSLSPSDAYMRQ